MPRPAHQYIVVQRYLRRGRPSRKWCLRYPLLDAQGHVSGWRSLSYPSRTLRDEKARLIEAELNSPPPTLLDITWRDLLGEYDAHLRLRQPRTQISVAATLRKFTQLAQPVDAWSLTARACRDYLERRGAGEPEAELIRWKRIDGIRVRQRVKVKRIPSSSTLAREFRELSAFFEWSIAEKYLEANPLANVPQPAAMQRQHIAPRPDEWLNLLAAAARADVHAPDPQQLHLLLLLAVTTGKRRSMLHTLEISQPPRGERRPWIELGDADTHGVALLHLPPSKHSRHDELIGVPPWVADRLASRMAHLPEGHKALFSGPWPRFAWDRLRRLLHYRGTWHGLRGASATANAVRRASEEASALIGHSSLRVTQKHYLEARQICVAAAAKWVQPAELPPLPPYSGPFAPANPPHPPADSAPRGPRG